MIEVLVALAFMAVITTGVAGLAVAIINGNAKSRDLATATYLAQDRLEAIRNTAYANIVASNASLPGSTDSATSCPNPVTGAAEMISGFRRTTLIICDTPARGIKRIVVTVSWTGGSTTEEMLVGQ